MKKWTEEEIIKSIEMLKTWASGKAMVINWGDVREAAEMLQQLQDENQRLRKAQDNYYLLLRDAVLDKNRERRGIIDLSQKEADHEKVER